MQGPHSICLLNDSFPPLIDGVANTVVNYAQELTKLGDQAIVVTPEHPDVQIIDGVLPAYGVPEEELSEYLTPDWSDEYINVRTAEAYATAHDVLHTEGLFLGTSAAAALHAAVQVGQRAEYAGKSIAVILPDNGMKYLSTPMYQQTI